MTEERKVLYHRYLRLMGEFLGYPSCCIDEHIRTIHDKQNCCHRSAGNQGMQTCPAHAHLTYDQIWGEDGLLGRNEYTDEFICGITIRLKFHAGLISEEEMVKRLKMTVLEYERYYATLEGDLIRG